MRKVGSTWAVFFFLLVIIVFAYSLTSIGRKDQPLSYWQLQSIISSRSDQIKKVVMTNGDSTVQVSMIGGDHEREVVVPIEAKESLVKQLNDAGIQLEVKDPDKSGFWFSMLSSFFLPILLLVGFLFMFRSAQKNSYVPPQTHDSTVTDLSVRVDLMEGEIRSLREEIRRMKEKPES